MSAPDTQSKTQTELGDRFKGKVAVITGAAQSIGFECAAAFGREQAHVVLADIDLGKAEASAQQLRDRGISALAIRLDVRDPAQSTALVGEVMAKFGRLDIWVNNAGFANHYDSFDLPVDLWQKTIDVMLSGTLYCSQAAGRAMRDQGGGVIINMASVNAFVAQPRRAAYCSAKAGIVMLTNVLAAEWAAHNIRVNGVAPSPVDMSGMAVFAATNVYANRHPMKRLAHMHEVTDAVLFLASEDASYVTGETLCIDGGWVSYGYV